MSDKDWNFHTLEAFLSNKIELFNRLYDQRLEDINKAALVFAETLDHRLESMNEFRRSLSDQRTEDEKARGRMIDTFISKEIWSVEHKALEAIVDKNTDRLNEIDKKLFAGSELRTNKKEGLSSKYMYASILSSVLAFVIAAASVVINLRHP